MVCFIIGAPFFYSTYFTFWFSCDTSIPSEQDTRVMKVLFLIFRKKNIYLFVCLFWSICLHDSYTIEYSVNMSINTDIRHIIEYGQYYFCGLNTDSWKSLYQLEIIRDYSIVFLCEASSSFFYIS